MEFTKQVKFSVGKRWAFKGSSAGAVLTRLNQLGSQRRERWGRDHWGLTLMSGPSQAPGSGTRLQEGAVGLAWTLAAATGIRSACLALHPLVELPKEVTCPEVTSSQDYV